MKQTSSNYIFIYSHNDNKFDSKLCGAHVTNINHMLLRARLNSHRNLRVYLTKLSSIEFDKFNSLWNLNFNKELFTKLQSYNLKEIPW